MTGRWLTFLTLALTTLVFGADSTNILIVVNQNAPISNTVGEYYVLKRHVPLSNICRIHASTAEEISREEYQSQIATPIASFLRTRRLTERILYIVMTAGVPLRIAGKSVGMASDIASVDSELTLLYAEMRGGNFSLNGYIKNPFFGQTNVPFAHSRFPIYLVTRLAGYDFADIKGIIERSLQATNTGKFVFDLKAQDGTEGNAWLEHAAKALPGDRVIIDESSRVLSDENAVIGYASWGSNDPDRKHRHLGFHWLPGSLATEYVSTNARTFLRPPESWDLGNWGDPRSWFAGAPQTLTADYIHDGATAVTGNVFEPYLPLCARPDLLIPAYYSGRNLAESYYLSIAGLSWMGVVIGDPLCSLGKPQPAR